MDQFFLFVCGCPRSGTTALVNLLNNHPSILLGMERYKYLATKEKINEINEDSFQPENFFDVKTNETNINWTNFYPDLKNKISQEKNIIWGDKYPHYYRFYQKIDNNLKQVKWIFMLRNVEDVAFSYNVRAQRKEDKWPEDADYTKAVFHWNEALKKTAKYLQNLENPERLFICEYEKIFSGNEKYFNLLMNFVGVHTTESTIEYYREITKDWKNRCNKNKKLKAEEIQYIKDNANYKLRNKLLRKYTTNE